MNTLLSVLANPLSFAAGTRIAAGITHPPAAAESPSSIGSPCRRTGVAHRRRLDRGNRRFDRLRRTVVIASVSGRR